MKLFNNNYSDLINKFHNKIKSFTAYNRSCLKCGNVDKEMKVIGVLSFCKKCHKEEFKNGSPVLKHTERYNTYKIWLEVYMDENLK